MDEKIEDRSLPDLDYHYCTSMLHEFGDDLLKGIKYTDGIEYIMNNGYSYLVTDIICVLKYKGGLHKSPFLICKFYKNINDNYQLVIAADWDGKKPIVPVHHQIYEFCDAEVEKLKIYYENSILMLSGER